MVFTILTEFCDRVTPKNPKFCLMNDDSDHNLNSYLRRAFHTALTAATKVIFKIWHEPTFPADKMCLIELNKY